MAGIGGTSYKTLFAALAFPLSEFRDGSGNLQ